ncbi:NAD(P)-dependent oxidoreductase [Streptomyces sp. SBT349]|uniref:NAD(P)-dependent oxidoreductase n=1 Tax=Streptomyces sp. SBT349 TaxID=1580539 RepID=UPI00066B1BB8|nr:NAD(P)H-binding protein [Streptomyces sp. SBT349]
MSEIVVFGAGGRAGRRAVAEARRRGHAVTAVVRAPARYTGQRDEAVRVVAGSVTDAALAAEVLTGADAVINAAAEYGPGTDPSSFFPAAAGALVAGVRHAGTGRLIAIGLSSFLTDVDGTSPLAGTELPEDFRAFRDAHLAGLDVLRAEGGDLDWLYISPAGDFDHRGPRTGRYTVAEHGDMADRISYPDFAIALLDEIETPRHRGVHLAVTG